MPYMSHRLGDTFNNKIQAGTGLQTFPLGSAGSVHQSQDSEEDAAVHGGRAGGQCHDLKGHQ